MEKHVVTQRNNKEAQELWRRLANDHGRCMMRLAPRSKEPIAGTQWQNLSYRPFDDIRFQPEDNAAILTKDIIVLDVDNPKLFSREVPETITVKTGKGYHYYFKRPDSADYRNRSRKREGFDVRANGGYVVAPGSIHPNGSLYELIRDVPLADPPEWLLKLSLGKVRQFKSCRRSGYTSSLNIDDDTLRLLDEGVPVGQRSHVIFRVINRLIEAGLDDDSIVDALLDSALSSKSEDPDWWYSEIDRAYDEREDIFIPDDLSIHFKALAEYALKDAVRMLRDHRNVVSEAQEEGLRALMKTFSGLASGSMVGRVAAPLPTGFGKTTSIVAFLGRSYSMDMLGRDFSVAVASSKVEEICELYHRLVEKGVPRQMISLVHSYNDGSNVETDPDGLLPDGYASVPATRDERGNIDYSRPILLVTHNRIKSGFSFDDVLTGRTFLIWDESMISTEARTLSVEAIALGVTALETALHQQVENLQETFNYLNACHQVISREVQRLRSGSAKQILKFPLKALPAADMKRAIREVDTRNAGDFLKTLEELVKLSDRETAVQLSQDASLVCFDVVIPDAMENIVVLDASAKINKLMLLDRTIKIPLNFPSIEVSYSASSFHRINHGAGRSSIEPALQREDLKQELLEIIKEHPGENILFFTYKENKGELHHRQAIEDFLESQGIDLQERANGRLRINWSTHGRETATNKYSFCSVVVFVGVLHKPQSAYIAETIGQLREITMEVKPLKVTDVKRGQHSTLIHQGSSRGQSRIFNEGVAGSVTTYYTYPDDSLEFYLKQVLPGATFVTRRCKALKPRTRVEEAMDIVVSFLNSTELREVSTRMLNAFVDGWKDFSESTRKRVPKLINDDPQMPWKHRGRSLVRV